MKTTEQYQSVIDRLKVSKKIVAVTHINPDGDALGSLCFFQEFCRALELDCTAYCAGPLPQTLQFLPNFSLILTDKDKLVISDFDLIVSLDCGSVARTNLSTEISKRTKDQFFLEIDHHPSNEKLSDLELRETNAASTTEILFSLAKAADVSLSSEMSSCLLTGVLTDTAHFVHSSATTQTIAAAAQMISHGANISRISDLVTRTKNIAALKLWGIVLSRLIKEPKYGLVYTVITAEDIVGSGAGPETLDGIAGFISGLEEARFIMVLHDTGTGTVRGSLRTTRSDLDISRLARFFGGGGHVKASGFNIPGRLECVDTRWRLV